MDKIQVDQVLERGSSPVNEDCLLMESPLFGVFDGATSLSQAPVPLGQHRTGGTMAAEIARDVFTANHYSLPRLAREANTAIRQKMTDHGVPLERSEQIWSTSAAVIRIRDDGMEWFRTGDAQILLIHRDGGHLALGDVTDHDYPTLAMMKGQRDNTLDNPLLRRQVLKVRDGMNKTYGVLNGDPRASRFFNSGLTPLEGVAGALLFTDGLSLPSATPSPRPDFAPLVRDYLALGLDGLHRKIRQMEESDPLRKTYPRFKCHDDIAAVALTFSPFSG